MAAYRYLIVGGGMTGDAACRGIRDHDADGSIAMIASESHDPYARPPLSKGLWTGKEESSVFRGTPDLGVEVGQVALEVGHAGGREDRAPPQGKAIEQQPEELQQERGEGVLDPIHRPRWAPVRSADGR